MAAHQHVLAALQRGVDEPIGHLQAAPVVVHGVHFAVLDGLCARVYVRVCVGMRGDR